MPIEFIRDEFLEGKKEELDDIYKTLSEKPKILDRKVLFMRRFTLALMGQYKVEKYVHEKHAEIERINKIIEEHTNELFKSIPSPRVPVPQNVPRPQLKVPIPLKKEIKIPEPISQDNSEVKKEAVAPNPL